jgi:integrase
MEENASEGTAARRRGRLRVSMPFDQWPGADRAAWKRAVRPGSLLDEGAGPASRWRPTSSAAVIQCYGHWLAFLSGRGELIDCSDPAERLRPDQVQAFVAVLREGRTSGTVANTIKRLLMAAHVMWPGQDWSWLRRLRGRLQQRAEPPRSKLGRMVSPAALLDLGRTLMDEAETLLAGQPLDAALRYRDGLLLGLLALAPERRRNLVSIEIGRHLEQSTDGWRLGFEGEETKNRRLRELRFPPDLDAALRRYLLVFRPILLARGQDSAAAAAHLWVTMGGAAMSPQRLRQVVRRHTGERLGIAMTPHLARTAAATFLGEHHPELVRIAAPVLAHESFRTTDRVYILAQGQYALRQHHNSITARRAALRQTQKRRARST